MMKTIGSVLGVATALATHRFAMDGNVAMTIFGCFGMCILWDFVKGG